MNQNSEDEQYLQEVADGAWGDGPGVRGAARDRLASMQTALNASEKGLLDWLSRGDGQYGECHGKTLDGLIERGLVKVGDQQTGLDNGFIAKGADIMYRAVSITDAGRSALSLTSSEFSK